MTVEEVKRFLESRGVPVEEVEVYDEYADLSFDETRWIQVGEDYLMLGETITDHDGSSIFHPYGETDSLEGLETLFKKHLEILI
jgi:hypothetical protein